MKNLIFSKTLGPYTRLARLDRPIGIWLLALPGWWTLVLTPAGPHWGLMALFGAGAVVMRAAGCVINDLWDRDLDRQVVRTKDRPLASGEISPRNALIFLGILLLCGFFILLQMNFLTVALGLAVMPLVVLYPLVKRLTWWPQAFLGLTFNAGALMGWSAATGSLALPALLLYAAGIFWTLGYDTIYAYQDIEDDALAGIKSTARLFGDQGKKAVAVFYALSWVLALLAVVLADQFDTWMPLKMLFPAAHMVWQLRSWDVKDPASALRVFRSNRDYGLLVLLACFPVP